MRHKRTITNRLGPARSTLRTTISGLTWLIALIVLQPVSGEAQTVQGFTKPLGKPKVLLLWSADTTVPKIGYNVYRKLVAGTKWPNSPLNSSPLRPITNCSEFKAAMPPSSTDWAMLSIALADSTGGIPPVTPLGNVCSITSFGVGSEKWNRTQLFASYRPNVAYVLGQAFRDNGADVGETYQYRVVRVTSDGKELPLGSDAEITITVGTPGAIPTPKDLQVVAGDSKVQVLWQIPKLITMQGFELVRSTIPAGPWKKVSDVDFSAETTTTIHQDTLNPSKHGFVDYERYDSLGGPTTHPVRQTTGVMSNIAGPEDGTKYFYKVRHKDILGNGGTWSSVVSATPYDSTRPGTPQGIEVTAIESMNSMKIRWTRVMNDIDGHQESVDGYRVYRYDNPEDPNVGAVAVGGLVAQPGDTSTTITTYDTWGNLRDNCGDKTWYYRVETIDNAGNISFRSIAVGDALKDTTRPADVKGTEAKGFNDFIKVLWDLNTDCDISEYRIYRSHCNYDLWMPCPEDDWDDDAKKLFADWRHDISEKICDDYDYDPSHHPSSIPNESDCLPPHVKDDCSGPFQLVGIVTHEEALKRKQEEGKAFFDDQTVPEESPICYAYIVKAVDRSQNESGFFPIPDPVNEIIVCEKLRDKTPPGPAIISGLFARDSTIVVDWIGPPVQDIAAYHVYRSEDEAGPYHFVGGRTVVPPPGQGVRLTKEYTPPAVVACGSIPLVSRDYMSAGRIVDSSVIPKEIYWYKVVGVDQEGNETPYDSAVGISTFTFKSKRESPPEITSITPADGPCALRIEFASAYDSTTMKGFVLFRSRQLNGDYHQVGNIIPENSYLDVTVARNKTYWYRLAILRSDGSLTQLSTAKHGTHP